MLPPVREFDREFLHSPTHSAVVQASIFTQRVRTY